jgi:hypothetical protein
MSIYVQESVRDEKNKNGRAKEERERARLRVEGGREREKERGEPRTILTWCLAINEMASSRLSGSLNRPEVRKM